jgi:hypothetical protein
MILLDTNVLIYASTEQSPFRDAPSLPLPDFFMVPMLRLWAGRSRQPMKDVSESISRQSPF